MEVERADILSGAIAGDPKYTRHFLYGDLLVHLVHAAGFPCSSGIFLLIN